MKDFCKGKVGNSKIFLFHKAINPPLNIVKIDLSGRQEINQNFFLNSPSAYSKKVIEEDHGKIVE